MVNRFKRGDLFIKEGIEYTVLKVSNLKDLITFKPTNSENKYDIKEFVLTNVLRQLEMGKIVKINGKK